MVFLTGSPKKKQASKTTETNKKKNFIFFKNLLCNLKEILLNLKAPKNFGKTKSSKNQIVQNRQYSKNAFFQNIQKTQKTFSQK